MTEKKILELLGIEENNQQQAAELINQFRKLNRLYPANSIWLKGDYGCYVFGCIVDSTKDLIVVE